MGGGERREQREERAKRRESKESREQRAESREKRERERERETHVGIAAVVVIAGGGLETGEHGVVYGQVVSCSTSISEHEGLSLGLQVQCILTGSSDKDGLEA